MRLYKIDGVVSIAQSVKWSGKTPFALGAITFFFFPPRSTDHLGLRSTMSPSYLAATTSVLGHDILFYFTIFINKVMREQDQ